MASHKLGAWACHASEALLLSSTSRPTAQNPPDRNRLRSQRMMMLGGSRRRFEYVLRSFPMLRKHGVSCNSLMRNFSRIKSSSVSEIERSVAKMLADVDKKVAALKATARKGSKSEMDSMKSVLKKDFMIMTEATGDLKEIVADKLAKDAGNNEEWLSLTESMDAMRNKLVLIRKELEGLKLMIPMLSPEADDVLSEASVLGTTMISDLKLDPESSITRSFGAFKTSLQEGNDGAENIKQVLYKLEAMKKTGSASDREKVIAFESGPLTSFIEKYVAAFDVNDIRAPKRSMNQADQPTPKEKQKEEKSGVGSNSNVDKMDAVDQSVAAPPAPVKDENTLGSIVSPFITGGSSVFLPDIDDYVLDGGFNGGGGNGSWGRGDGSGDDDELDDTSVIWTIILLLMSYLLLLMLCLEGNKYVSLYWNQLMSTGRPEETASWIQAMASSSSENDSDRDEENNDIFSGGGPAGWLLSQPKLRKQKAPKQKEPIQG